jgi:hypothetical protein
VIASKTESGKRALAIGEDVGIAMVPLLKSAPVEGDDRVIFWAAFVGSIYGQMAADVGRDADNAVIAIASKVLDNVRLDESAH